MRFIRPRKRNSGQCATRLKRPHAKHQPVLVGTITIENSELLSGMLKRRGIKHNVLNAKYHELEAEDRCPGRRS